RGDDPPQPLAAHRPAGVRRGRTRRLHRRHGLRADRLHRPCGRTHGRAMAGPVTAHQALKDWLAYLEQERRSSPRTVRAYGDNVLAYLALLQQHRGAAIARDDLAVVEPRNPRSHLAFTRSRDHPSPPR